MNNEWKEYCEYVARVSSKSMEQVSEAIRMLMLTAGRGKCIDERMKMLADDIYELAESEEKIIGNKRNGTQDRRQAFGGLF